METIDEIRLKGLLHVVVQAFAENFLNRNDGSETIVRRWQMSHYQM